MIRCYLLKSSLIFDSMPTTLYLAFIFLYNIWFDKFLISFESKHSVYIFLTAWSVPNGFRQSLKSQNKICDIATFQHHFQLYGEFIWTTLPPGGQHIKCIKVT